MYVNHSLHTLYQHNDRRPRAIVQKMENNEKRILQDHTAAMRDLQNDLQTFFKIAHKILPEIEQTKTLTRLEKEMEEMKNKSWDLV